MTRHEINNEYFDWMYNLVHSKRYSKRLSYRKLLIHLHSRQFTYTIGMDGNRAEDGVDLRYRFGYENGIESAIIAEYLDDKPCSILEMLVALSMRCEEHIMDNPDIGNRTSKWFWDMIVNLGLDSMYDSKFDKGYFDDTIDRFINREYGRNGEGGLFTIPNCKHDLRTTEIWYQMMWYLDQVLEN